jgi:hypothetical protein
MKPTIIRRVPRCPLIIAVGIGATLLGCDALNDINRTGGNSDQGYFQIAPTCNLAKGAYLEFSVGDFETLSGAASGIDMTEPVSEDEDVVSIRDYDSSGSLEAEGVDAGTSLISFSAKADGDVIDDSFELKVVEVKELAFEPCASGGVYVRGTRIELPYRFNPSSSKDVLGLGYYPFTISPEASMTLEESASTETYFSLVIEDAAEDSVTLSSSVDDTTLHLAVVDMDAINGVASLGETTNSTGAYLSIDLRPLVDGQPVCSKVRRIIRTNNPDACTIEGATNGELETTELSAQLYLSAAGSCEVTVEFPDVSLLFSLGVFTVTASSSSSGTDDWD